MKLSLTTILLLILCRSYAEPLKLEASEAKIDQLQNKNFEEMTASQRRIYNKWVARRAKLIKNKIFERYGRYGKNF